MGAYGGPGQPCGPWDQTLLGNRKDILQFTSNILTDDLAITGETFATLFVESTTIDTDFVVKLLDVFPNGTRLLVQDSIIRMRWRDPSQGTQKMTLGKIYEVNVTINFISYIFPKGHQIGVDVTSSNFPHFSVNRNTGAALSHDTGKNVTTLNTVHMGSSSASSITLPVVPIGDLKPWNLPKIPHLDALAELF
eukprot:NODE_5630_length_925_cov_19.305486_g5407_i0.p1 GENE.NODE_5630_length_925_cov_19.305486_g5407_i0~~NODE_5630_length_925_cov_19.305486_g5407_i0.p1  ORF type:complete len:193 (+),score=29.94 NODE_5630_length_925_cov_19.305486_g5407_i0:308-886(+)